MLILSPEVINNIQTIIIPEIIAASNITMRAYEQGTEEDGTNFFDDYFMGCACWNNLYNRLDLRLDGHPFFNKTTSQRVMRISCNNTEELITFYVSRVDSEVRIPRSGKSIKLALQEWFFLSEECQEIISKSNSNIYVIGYDFSAEKGLGKITFDMLSTLGKNNFVSSPIFDFTNEGTLPLMVRHQMEEITPPLVVARPLAAK